MSRAAKRFIAKKLGNIETLRAMPLLEQANRFQESRAIEFPELELIYVPIPKAANRSIKLAFAHRLGMPYENHDVHALKWKFVNRRQLERSSFFRFIFVRHPLDRLLSCYTQKIVKLERKGGMRPEFWRHGSRFNAQMSFDDFVRAVAQIPDDVADVHFRSQHRFVVSGDPGELPLEFIGKFESLESDWGKFAPHFDLPKLPVSNKSRHKPWEEMYTDELQAIATARYEEDMRVFGYS